MNEIEAPAYMRGFFIDFGHESYRVMKIVNMKETDHLPLCYDFSFNKETMTLFFSIQKWLLPRMQYLFQGETRLMDYMYQTHGGDSSLFEKFGQQGMPFGWDDSLVWHGESEDAVTYSYAFTPVLERTKEVCDRCHGKKRDPLSKFPCHSCRASGKKHIPSKRAFGTMLISMYPVMTIVNTALSENCSAHPKDPWWIPQTDKKQRIAMEWSETSGMHNCAMQAWIDDEVFEKVHALSDEQVGSIVSAMQETEMTLLLNKKLDTSFRFGFYGKHCMFSVPGNACTLGTSDYGMGMFGRIGKTLTPHNLDTRFQQIGFVVGLATLADLTK